MSTPATPPKKNRASYTIQGHHLGPQARSLRLAAWPQLGSHLTLACPLRSIGGLPPPTFFFPFRSIRKYLGCVTFQNTRPKPLKPRSPKIVKQVGRTVTQGARWLGLIDAFAKPSPSLSAQVQKIKLSCNSDARKNIQKLLNKIAFDK